MRSFRSLALAALALSAAVSAQALDETRHPALRHLVGCHGSCSSHNDCDGQLACIRGKCNDDPDMGTNICQGGAPAPPPSDGTCRPQGYLDGIYVEECNTGHYSECCKEGERYPKYYCSPAVSRATPATLTLNGFGEGEDGGGEASCDGQHHENTEYIVALSTGWFADRSRCHKQIEISANGRKVRATVIDECDSRAGCDYNHAYQPPCRNNIVDASDAVWRALGIGPGDDRYGMLENIQWRDV